MTVLATEELIESNRNGKDFLALTPKKKLLSDEAKDVLTMVSHELMG